MSDIAISIELARDGWQTENTYCNHFGEPPPNPGVYLFLHVDLDLLAKPRPQRVLYVGMSKNIRNRVSGHEVLREVRDLYVQKWHKSVPANELRKIEKQLIQKFNPPFNIIHRKRGL